MFYFKWNCIKSNRIGGEGVAYSLYPSAATHGGFCRVVVLYSMSCCIVIDSFLSVVMTIRCGGGGHLSIPLALFFRYRLIYLGDCTVLVDISTQTWRQ